MRERIAGETVLTATSHGVSILSLDGLFSGKIYLKMSYVINL
jgi:hypothetical protein